MEKEKEKSFATLIISVIAVVVVIFGLFAFVSDKPQKNNNQIPDSSTGLAATTSNTLNSEERSGKGPYWYLGSASLCGQGAQEWADSLSKNSTQANTAYFVVTSHYDASNNSCYFELHNILPIPNGTTADTYTLYVTGGPSEYEVSLSAFVPTEIADCSAYSSGQTPCHYYGPIREQRSIIGGGNKPLWIPTYGMTDTNPPLMGYMDFQTLVTADMSAN